MFSPIQQPTPISQILCRILIVLAVLTLFQALFLMFTYSYKSITHLVSFIIYIVSVCKLSYFGCIINQIINITLIWFLLLEVPVWLCRWLSNLKWASMKSIWVARGSIKWVPLFLASSVFISILLPISNSSKLHMRSSKFKINLLMKSEINVKIAVLSETEIGATDMIDQNAQPNRLI